MTALRYQIGQMIGHERTRRGWSQRELERQSGVAQYTIARVERGEGQTNFACIERILSALDKGLQVVEDRQ